MKNNCLRDRERNAIILFSLLMILVAVSILSICVGAVMYSPMQLFTESSTSAAGRILRYSRIPRTCCSLLAGASLAVSGAVIQNVLVNPLAAPNIIGVNSGAGLMVAVCCAFLPFAPGLVPVFAFLGALFSVLLVLGISEGVGASRMTLVLSGVAISSLFTGLTDAVVTFVPDALSGYTDFKIGGFRGVTMERLQPASVMIMIGFVVILVLVRRMDILGLGTETAQSLGLRVRPVRFLLLLAAALLAGAAVSFSGLMGFVGLLVPHIMRKLVGNEGLPLVIGCAFGGAILVSVCDTLARSLFSPFEIPVGIVLSLLGAPFFLWLLLRNKRRGHV